MRKDETGLTEEQWARLEALEAMPEENIDTSDIPEITDWSTACRGKFYLPGVQRVTLQLDPDVLDWFKAHTPAGATYQEVIRRALRTYMEKSIS